MWVTAFPERKSLPKTEEHSDLELLASIGELPAKTSIFYGVTYQLDFDKPNPPDREKTDEGKVKDFFSVEQMKQIRECLYEGEVPQQVEIYGRAVQCGTGEYAGRMTILVKLMNGRPVKLYENRFYENAGSNTRAMSIDSILVPLDKLRFLKEEASIEK